MTEGDIIVHGRLRFRKPSHFFPWFLKPFCKSLIFVCPSCGFVEWYVEKPEIFRDGD